MNEETPENQQDSVIETEVPSNLKQAIENEDQKDLDSLSEFQEGEQAEKTQEQRMEEYFYKYSLAMRQSLGYYLNILSAEYGDDTQTITMEMITMLSAVVAEAADNSFVYDKDKDIFMNMVEQTSKDLLEKMKQNRDETRPDEAENIDTESSGKTNQYNGYKPGDKTESGIVISGG